MIYPRLLTAGFDLKGRDMWFTTRCSFFLFLFLSILFPINPTNLKNLSEKHDQTSINLTNVFDHGLTISLSIFLLLIYLFIRLNLPVYVLMICKWFKIRAQFAFWLNIKETQPSKYIVKNRNAIFLDSVLFWSFTHLTVYETTFIKVIACV